MKIDLNSLVVEHNAKEDRFEINLENDQPLVQYVLRGKTMQVIRTFVPPELEGQGIAAKMTRVVLEYAKENHFRIVPLCSYTATYIERHPEYKELLN
jgi:predicted GNAT family acetyltransferase